jgi:3-oxoadipate enol-lactonase
MGGYVALAFARMFPRRLKALILSDTRAEADSPEARAKREENIAYVSTHNAREFIERVLPGQISDATKQNSHIVNELTEIGASQNPQGIVHALQALRDRHDATGELKNIAVPTLVIGGCDDAITSPQVLESLASGIPGAQLHIIEGAGHLANIEKADEWNARVRELINL